MVRKYKLVVKRLPSKVCVSIRAAKGRTLTRKKYVKYGRKRRVGRKRRRKRRRRTKWITFWKQCARKYRTKRRKKPRNIVKACARRYRAGLRP